MVDWTRKTAVDLTLAYTRGEVSAREVTDQYADRVRGSTLGAFVTPLLEQARDRARQVDQARQSGDAPGMLAGVPVAIKDNLVTDFAPTTCASRILARFESPYTATVVERLIDAGAVVLGKTNMDEFAMGSSNENSAIGPVRNPHDPERIPGGSSGGSAAAVADYLCCVALGSDTGGSVRQPAAHCGCVGFKPTYGAISRYGLVAFASSLDQVGPLTRSVADAALVYDVIAGPDPRDSTCTHRSLPSARDAVAAPPHRVRLGVVREALDEGLEPDVAEAVERTIEMCRQSGWPVHEVSLPHLHLGVATYYIIANAEASANLARYDGVRYGQRAEHPRDLTSLYERSRGEGFGAEAKRRIMLGTYVLSAGYYDAYYLRALSIRNLIRDDFRRAFESVDVLLSPTTPGVAFRLGERIDDPLAMYLSDIYTVPANLAGLPAISLPVGKTQGGLPIGAQLWGPRFSDGRLLAAAACLETLIGYDPH